MIKQLTIFIVLSLSAFLIASQCGAPNPCTNDACCECRESANPTTGVGYLEYMSSCLTGGEHCIGTTGCRLCFRNVTGAINVGNRPVCRKFQLPTTNTSTNVSTACYNTSCCIARQNANPLNGIGYLEFNTSCLSGGLHCIGNTGCRFCINPVPGVTNIGDRPVCARYSPAPPPPVCTGLTSTACASTAGCSYCYSMEQCISSTEQLCCGPYRLHAIICAANTSTCCGGYYSPDYARCCNALTENCCSGMRHTLCCPKAKKCCGIGLYGNCCNTSDNCCTNPGYDISWCCPGTSSCDTVNPLRCI